MFPFKVTGMLLSSGWGGKVASGVYKGVQGRIDRTRSWRGGGPGRRACRESGLEGLFFFLIEKGWGGRCAGEKMSSWEEEKDRPSTPGFLSKIGPIVASAE